jgi:hypothetical protein
MNMKKLVCALVSILSFAACSQADLITVTISNADFNIAPVGGWAGGNAAPEWDNRSPFNNEASDAFNHSGASGGSLKIWAGAGLYAAHQDTSVLNNGVIPVGASQCVLSFWAYTPTSDYYTNGSINLHIEWFTNFTAGGEVASRTITYLPPNISADSWQQYSTTSAVPANATHWRFVIEQGTPTVSGAVFLDDVGVTVTTIPEPATAALLLGTGVLAPLYYYRRRRKLNVRP